MTDIKATLTVTTTIKATIDEVWKCWTTPADIMNWNNPSDDWHTILVEVDLREDGLFLFRMQSKDGNEGFDYCGKYDKVKKNSVIELTTTDGRKTTNTFITGKDETIITETFEAEAQTPIDVQRDFCQGVLNNFKKYVEKVK